MRLRTTHIDEFQILGVRDLVPSDRKSGDSLRDWAEFVVPTEPGIQRTPKLGVSVRNLDPFWTRRGVCRRLRSIRSVFRRQQVLWVQVVQQIAQSLRMHQPVFDAEIRDVLGHQIEDSVHCVAHAATIGARFVEAGPITAGVRREVRLSRVDAKREELVELWLKGVESKTVLTDHVPVERLHVSHVEVEAVAFGNRPLEQ